MEKYVIYAVSNAYTGDDVLLYVKAFDPDAHDGRGHAAFTPHQADALQFDSHKEVFEFWRQTSTVLPVRPDGKPNRPLTAYTCEFLKVGQEPMHKGE